MKMIKRKQHGLHNNTVPSKDNPSKKTGPKVGTSEYHMKTHIVFVETCNKSKLNNKATLVGITSSELGYSKLSFLSARPN